MKVPISLVSDLVVALFVCWVLTAAITAHAQQPDAINAAAPDLVGSSWLNTAGGKPITLASRKGKVTVVEFWTYG
jgi:hypothetical protein